MSKFSFFNTGIHNTIPEKNITLKEAYNYIISGAPKEATKRLRNETNPDERAQIKRTQFKFATFSGTFSKRAVAELDCFSGLICQDIDNVDDCEAAKNQLISHPYCKPTLLFTSPSGNGVKVVYRVSIDTADQVGQAYDYIADMIEDELEVAVDPNPKSVVSACFLPWDPEAYLNEDAATVEIPQDKLSSPQVGSFTPSNENSLEKVKACVDYIEEKQINMAEGYEDWYKIGLSLASLGAAGREPFHRVSKVSSKYDAIECDVKFSSLLETSTKEVSLGTFFDHCKNHNLPLSDILKPFNPTLNLAKPKKNFWDDHEKKQHKETVQNLTENADHPLVDRLYEQYGVGHKALCDNNIGLGSVTLPSGQTKEVLFAPYEKGRRAFYLNEDELCYTDLADSSPYDSFFGLENTLEKGTGVIVNNVFDAMYLSSIRDDIDVISNLEPSNPILSSQQGEILREKLKYWKILYILKPAINGSEMKQALSYCRLYADLLPVDSVVYLMNLDQNDKSLFQATRDSDVLSGKQVFPEAMVVWNSVTQNNRFWMSDERGKLQIDEVRFARTMQRNGFKKSYMGDADKPTLLRDENNILDTVSTHRMADYVVQNILDHYSPIIDYNKTEDGRKPITSRQIRSVFFKYREKVLNSNITAIFRNEDPDVMTDSASEAYLYYKNGVAQVSKKGINMKEYESMPGKVWRSQILQREFNNSTPSGKGEFEQFVENVAGGDPDRIRSFKSVLGYLIHTYKNKSASPAIILVDEYSSSGLAQGGTGKGLFTQSIKNLRQQRYISGKNIATDSRFIFMDVQPGDQSIFFDDVKEDFDFESLFNIITDDMQVEAKHKNRFTIPFAESPKVVLATNSYIKGRGSSFRRRQFTLPFSNHYSDTFKPSDEFGHNLFEDWSAKEWHNFDYFMIECIQLFLKEGLIRFSSGHYKHRKLQQATSPDFADWAEKYLETDVEYKAHVLFDGKDKTIDPHAPPIVEPEDSQGNTFPCFSDASNVLFKREYRTFIEWIRSFGAHKGWKLYDRKSYGYPVIRFEK